MPLRKQPQMQTVILMTCRPTIGCARRDNIGFCMQNAKPTGILNGKNDDENIRNEFTNYYEN